ncbi:MAG TPA: Ig domain-containing protein, partial [Firmicutes bacterium]|nr:Ig domain-containing protein [Bacillota bacterium]
REDVDSINIPIEIVEEMISDSIDGRDVVVLKMKTIGPGREDSEVATYTFTVDPEAVDPTKTPGGPPSGVFLDQNALDLPVGHTFQLEATVEPFNAINKNVIWSSSDTSVATVDTRGLVTVVGPGSAVITVETVDGSFKATCVINGPDGEADEPGIAAAEEDILPEEEKPEDPPEQLPEVDEQSFVEEDARVPASTVAEEPETPAQAPEPEDRADPQYPEEEDPVSPAFTAEDESPLPEGIWEYLAKKEDLSAAVTTSDESTGQPESSLSEVQVFEMSLGHTVPLPMPEQQKDLDLFAAAIFLFFVLSGASKKYIEYAKE